MSVADRSAHLRCPSLNRSSALIPPLLLGTELVITGEWCHGVLESHGENSAAFRGRGIQYHLGFHHFDDLCRSASLCLCLSLSVSRSLDLSHLFFLSVFSHCRGHITIANSHYLSTTLSSRILGGYFLGCELTPIFKEAYLDLLALADDPLASSSLDLLSLSSIVKVGCPSFCFLHSPVIRKI
jgi:hypothetical protein